MRRWQLTQGDRRRGRRKKSSDTETGRPYFLVFLVIVFLLPSVFPVSGFPLTTFPNISLASVCVSVCVSGAMGWRVWLTHWCDQGHRGTSLSLSLSVSLSLLLSSPNSTGMTSSRHLHCLFVCLFVYLVSRRDETSGSVSRTRNILLNTFHCRSLRVSNILLPDELLDKLTFSEDTIQ